MRSECDCNECRLACENKPGWFMPGEAEKAAETLGLPLARFIEEHCGVDYWEGDPDPVLFRFSRVYLLAPATVDMPPGTIYPSWPQGRCVFLKDGRCRIHAAKPFECAEYVHSDSHDDVSNRHRAVALAWVDHQQELASIVLRAKTREGG